MIEPTLTVIAQQAADAPPAQPLSVVIGAGLLAIVGLMMWSVTGYFITAAHEGGHALFGSAVGAAVLEVRLRRDSGHTNTLGTPGSVGHFVTIAMGYLGPAFFGVVGAVLLDDGRVRGVLWLTVFFLALLLTRVNDIRSVLVVLAGAGYTFLALRSSPGVQTLMAYTWVWFLLVGGVISVQRTAGTRKVDDSDFVQLRRMSLVPATLWVGILWLVNAAALAFGAAVMLQLVGQHATLDA